MTNVECAPNLSFFRSFVIRHSDFVIDSSFGFFSHLLLKSVNLLQSFFKKTCFWDKTQSVLKMKWYCVYTKPGQMEKARENIQRQGLEAFYPKIRVQRVIRGKKKWVVRPMFPNYLFAHFSLTQHYRSIHHTAGVSRVVSFGGLPPPVDEMIINELKTENAQGRVFALEPEGFKEGEKIRVIEGPFAGFSAVFKGELKSRDRVIILLNLLKTSVHSELSRNAITKE